ncbi:MAG: S41 family peptidase, partial [Ignavibacteria bacterium]
VTTARYYTPSGRLIQKPYENGKYLNNNTSTNFDGENIDHKNDKDSAKPEFKTFGGRTVYGGGGITPDYVVKLDTLTDYSVQLRRLNLFYIFTEGFMSGNKKKIEENYKTPVEFRDRFVVDENMLSDLKSMATEKGIAFNEEQYDKDLDFIKTSVKFQIARDIWGNNGSYLVWVNNDDQFMKAVTLFDDAIKLAKLKQ